MYLPGSIHLRLQRQDRSLTIGKVVVVKRKGTSFEMQHTSYESEIIVLCIFVDVS